MARRRRAAGAGAGPGAATNRFQFREEAGGLKGMGVGFLEWGASDPIPALPAQSSTLVSCLVEVGAASTSTTTAIHYSFREEWTC